MGMARRIYVILIAFSLVAGGAMPSMAMASQGHSQMASDGVTMHLMQGGGPQHSQPEPGTSDWHGSCGNFCLDCGCLSCQTRILSGAAAETIMTFDRFPSPRLLGQAPRLEGDVAKPPPKS